MPFVLSISIKNANVGVGSENTYVIFSIVKIKQRIIAMW